MGEIKMGNGNGCTPTERTKMIVKETAKKIAAFWSRSETIEWVSDTFNISIAQANHYYQAAMNYLVPDDEEELEERKKIVAMIGDTIKDAKANKDRKNALYGADILNKMNQRYVQKIEAEVNQKNEVKFDFGLEKNNEPNDDR